MLKVRDLVDQLRKIQDQDLPVYIASDPEGNNYHPVEGAQRNPEFYDDYDEMSLDAVVIWP